MRICRTFCFAGILLSLSSPVFGQTDRGLTANVASALSAKDFDKALSLLGPALKQSPRNPKLWTLQAIALSGKGDQNNALSAYQTALNISPEYVPALEGAAQIEYNAGNQNAVPLLNHLLKLRPDDPTAHAMLAVLAAKKGDCNDAVQHFSAVGPSLDSQPQLREEYGACLLKLKQPDKAIALDQRALELNPSDNESRRQLAAVQLMAEKPNDALDTLGPLLQSDKPDSKTMELAASAYEAAGNTKMAVNTLRQAIVADPHNVDLYLDFAAISMDHQSFQVGIDMVDVGLKAEPKSAPLYVARGVLYVQLAKYDDAQDDFEKADQLEPNQSLSFVAKGLELAQTNDPDQALKVVRSKLAAKPNDPYLLYLQADILAQSGPDPGTQNFQAAIHSATRAVALQPSLSPARDILAKLYLQAGENRLAIEQCREALKSNPKDQTALYHLIQALRKTGNRQELPDLLKRLAELRAESTKEEREHNRYKLVEAGTSPATPSEP
jgi:tetratricopeptide (TPR) repeat protein